MAVRNILRLKPQHLAVNVLLRADRRAERVRFRFFILPLPGINGNIPRLKIRAVENIDLRNFHCLVFRHINAEFIRKIKTDAAKPFEKIIHSEQGGVFIQRPPDATPFVIAPQIGFRIIAPENINIFARSLDDECVTTELPLVDPRLFRPFVDPENQ